MARQSGIIKARTIIISPFPVCIYEREFWAGIQPRSLGIPSYPFLLGPETFNCQYCSRDNLSSQNELTVRIASATAGNCKRLASLYLLIPSYIPRAAMMLAFRTAVGFSLSCSANQQAVDQVDTQIRTLKALFPEFDCGTALAAILVKGEFCSHDE